MIADASFTQKDNDYLETKYEEYKKVIKKESEDKTKWGEFEKFSDHLNLKGAVTFQWRSLSKLG